MKEQLKIPEKKPVKIGGIRQNCYALDCLMDTPVLATPNKEIKKYESLERVNLPNGFIEEIVEKDYPINSKSITSYADGADYRNDPNQAIANAPKRVNLGDITQVQEFIEKDPKQAIAVYKDIIAKVNAYFEAQKNKTQPVLNDTEKQDGGEK